MRIEHGRWLPHATVVITEARVAVVVEILPQRAEHRRTVNVSWNCEGKTGAFLELAEPT